MTEFCAITHAKEYFEVINSEMTIANKFKKDLMLSSLAFRTQEYVEQFWATLYDLKKEGESTLFWGYEDEYGTMHYDEYPTKEKAKKAAQAFFEQYCQETDINEEYENQYSVFQYDFEEESHPLQDEHTKINEEKFDVYFDPQDYNFNPRKEWGTY